MLKPEIDVEYLRTTLLELLSIPSPAGLTDEVVHYTCARLEALDIPYELTRRGAIRATLPGKAAAPARAIVTHLDTLGAMVCQLKDNGRLQLLPIGTWSSRFAEGGRVTLFTDCSSHRGTVLPLKASGHAFNEGVDQQPVAWDQVELRLDEFVEDRWGLQRLGVNVGDYVAFDTNPEIAPNGFVNARHLDDKGGVAALLAALKALREHELRLPVDLHPLFTITEEVGSGASAVLHGNASEMVSIDIAIVAPGQASKERGVCIAMLDSNGPFDYHLTRKLLGLCHQNDLEHHRDVYRFYHSDSTSALEAGNDIRTSLIGFGTDGSHGYERTHLSALLSVATLVTLYAQSGPTAARDARELGSIDGFSHQIEPDNLPPPQDPVPRPEEVFGSHRR